MTHWNELTLAVVRRGLSVSPDAFSDHLLSPYDRLADHIPGYSVPVVRTRLAQHLVEQVSSTWPGLVCTLLLTEDSTIGSVVQQVEASVSAWFGE